MDGGAEVPVDDSFRQVCRPGGMPFWWQRPEPFSPLGPSPTTVWQTSGVAIHHLPQAGRPEGWGRSVGEGRQAQTSLLCLKFPGAHVLRWLEAAGG